jgi:hypothetical protein
MLRINCVTNKFCNVNFELERETEAQATFRNPCTVSSPCKRKFVICPFVDKKQTEVIGRIGLNGHSHLGILGAFSLKICGYKNAEFFAEFKSIEKIAKSSIKDFSQAKTFYNQY